MNYDVQWGPRAEQMLAAIWLAADDRQAVTRATKWFDDQLARSPLELGESRASSIHRLAHYGPLGLVFEVIEDDKRVVVQAVFGVG